MTPAEEQILRNQSSIMQMLSALLINSPLEDGTPERAMSNALQCLKETRVFLETEHQQGRTVYDYADPS